MTDKAGDLAGYPVRAARRNVKHCSIKITIGASGAVSSTESDDPACTAAKNAGTGTYDLTFPKALDARADVEILSAAGTVSQWYLAAKSATAGTAQLITRAGGGSATNPASGDVISIRFTLYPDPVP